VREQAQQPHISIPTPFFLAREGVKTPFASGLGAADIGGLDMGGAAFGASTGMVGTIGLADGCSSIRG